MLKKNSLLWTTLLLLFSSPLAPLRAQPADTVRTSDSLEVFLDAFFAERMEALRLPGLAFAMVQDGEVLIAKGYGHADLERRLPVDPARTLFQVASVSKLFTATAALQLAEAGRLDLHTDVNTYLRQFQLDDAFDEPVTLQHLLTHTAGFDERLIGYMARTADEVTPLGPYLAERMPPRTLPPGFVTSYSNHGYALAGHLVEEAAGIPFAAYIQQQILAPLGMSHSTFELPLPEPLAADLATGYQYVGDRYEPQPIFYRNAPPAGAMSATALDMTRFMITHLQGGRYGEVRLLKEATAQEMHRQQFTHHPALTGLAYAFAEHRENGRRALAHGGQTPGHSSLLFLLPEENIGFFVTANRMTNELGQALVPQLLDYLFPATEPEPPTPLTGYRSRADRYTGWYQLTRYARRSLEELPQLFGGQLFVGATEEGLLQVRGETWVEVEPLLFRRVDAEDYLAFREDEKGRVTHLFRGININGAAFPGAYERLAWYEEGGFLNEYLSWLAVGPVLLLVLWLLGVGLRAAFRWLRHKERPALRLQGRGRALLTLTGALLFTAMAILFTFRFIAPSVQILANGGDLFFGMPARMGWLLWLPLLMTPLALGMAYLTVQAWRKRQWSLLGRCCYTLLTLTALLWIDIFIRYNYLGFQY